MLSVELLLTHGFPVPLIFREEMDVKSIEVCTEKDMNLYFSLPTSRKIFLQFA